MSNPIPTKLRPYSLPPRVADTNVSQFYAWIQTSLNTLIGQQVPPATGSQALNPPSINPTTSQIISAGSRTSSLTTNFGYTCPSSTSIGIYWDGTNGSTVLRIYRDDGTIAGPFPGHQIITGLAASTTYFFYPYFSEAQQRVIFVAAPGAVGSPPCAYTKQSIAVAQQQILRGNIALATNLAITGITTPASGSTPAVNAGGGGSSGGAYLGRELSA